MTETVKRGRGRPATGLTPIASFRLEARYLDMLSAIAARRGLKGRTAVLRMLIDRQHRHDQRRAERQTAAESSEESQP